MRTGRLYKAATCLSLTLISAIAPGLSAYGQVINDYYPKQSPNPFDSQAQAGGSTSSAGTTSGSATGSATAPAAGSSSPAQSAAAAADQGNSTVWTPSGSTPASTTTTISPSTTSPSTTSSTPAATAPAAPAKPAVPFSNVKDPLVTHPGVDDAAAAVLPNSGTAIPNMVAPVFKPGSTAAAEQARAAAAAKARANQPMKLYGRIEQLTATKGANFPIVLKAMTAQMDNTPSSKLSGKVGTDPTLFSGTIAKSFPSDYRGNWGGTLKVWTVVQDPICYRIDPVEAAKLAKIFKSGSEGQVNFMFANDVKGGIYLAPAQVMFQESGADAGLGQQMSQMMGGQSLAQMGPMGAMMQQMAASMPVPVIFSFGDIQSSSMAKGLSGNDFVQRTLRNTTRQLAPNVLEQDVVAESNEIMKATGQPRKRYSESVLRFTKLNEQQMYVQAAAVTYGPDRKFQDKIIMYGYVTKGQVAQTNPYAGIMGGMPGGGQIPGAGSIFGGGNGQSPQLPGGIDMDAIKKMFGGQ